MVENISITFPTMKARDLRAFLGNCREFKVSAGYGASHISSKILKRMGCGIDDCVDTYEFLCFFIKDARRRCPICGKHHNDTHGIIHRLHDEVIMAGDLATAAESFSDERIKPIIYSRPAICEECCSNFHNFHIRSRVRDDGLENFVYSRIKKCRTAADVKTIFSSDKIEDSKESGPYGYSLTLDMVLSVARKFPGFSLPIINSRFLGGQQKPIEEMHKSISIIRHIRRKYKIRGDVCKDWTFIKRMRDQKREMMSDLQEYIDHANIHKRFPNFYGTPNWIDRVFYKKLNMDVPVEARLQAFKASKLAR